MSFVSSKPDPYPTPVDVVVYLISAIMNRVIKRFYCTEHLAIAFGLLIGNRTSNDRIHGKLKYIVLEST